MAAAAFLMNTRRPILRLPIGAAETSVRRRLWAALGQASACPYLITWGFSVDDRVLGMRDGNRRVD